MKCGALDFFLPSVSVVVSENIGEGGETGWQPISATSLQQSFEL